MTNKKLKIQTELEDLTKRWKRALADYQNLEKRVETGQQEFVRFANAGLVLKILPALDTLKKAEKHLQDEGLRLAIKQLRDGLEEEGLKRIEVLGRDFDPNLMECVGVEEGEENKVLEETRTGYWLNEKLLRPAQVKVGKQQKD